MSRRLAFRYALDPLLEKSSWDLDALRAELATANRLLADCQRALDDAQCEMRAVLAEQAERHGAGLALDLTQEAAWRRYAQRLQERVRERLEACQEAMGLHELVTQDICRALQAQGSLEKHKDQQAREHLNEQLAAEIKHADEAWLLRMNFQEASP